MLKLIMTHPCHAKTAETGSAVLKPYRLPKVGFGKICTQNLPKSFFSKLSIASEVVPNWMRSRNDDTGALGPLNVRVAILLLPDNRKYRHFSNSWHDCDSIFMANIQKAPLGGFFEYSI